MHIRTEIEPDPQSGLCHHLLGLVILDILDRIRHHDLNLTWHLVSRTGQFKRRFPVVFVAISVFCRGSKCDKTDLSCTKHCPVRAPDLIHLLILVLYKSLTYLVTCLLTSLLIYFCKAGHVPFPGRRS